MRTSLALLSLSSILLATVLEAQDAGAVPRGPSGTTVDTGTSGMRVMPVKGSRGQVQATPVLTEDGFRWNYSVLGRRRASVGKGTRSGAGGGPEAATAPTKALVSCFDNTQTNGFNSFGEAGTEWVDWAAKKGGKTGIVSRFSFSYSTQARGVAEGGPGGAIGVSFFSGTTGFCNRGKRVHVPGDADDVFTFTGLPGATGTQSFGNYTITVNLDDDQMFLLPDGRIGWSYVFMTPPGSTAATGVRLAGPPMMSNNVVNTGWSDAFDLWSSPMPVASCGGTFSFGGCTGPTTFFVPPPCASFYMKIWERTDYPATARIDDPRNRSGLRELGPPVIGATWELEVDLGPSGENNTSLIALSTNMASQPMPLLPPGLGVLLFEPPAIGLDRTMSLTDVARHSIPMPASSSLNGFSFCAQAFVLRLEEGKGVVGTVEALNALLGTLRPE